MRGVAFFGLALFAWLAIEGAKVKPSAANESRIVSFYSKEDGALCIVGGPEGYTDVLIGECTSPGAKFVFDARQGRIRSVQRPGQCIDGSVGGEPTLLFMRPCKPQMIETWTYDEAGTRLRGTNGCVGAVGKVATYGKLATQVCAPGSKQRWVMNDAIAAPSAPKPQADQQSRELSGSWSPPQNGAIDRRAIPAGSEANGQPLYVCAGHHNGGLHPGKTRPGFRGCNIGYGGREVEASSYVVFVGTGRWTPASQGAIPKGAMEGGREADGRVLYVCRAGFNGGVHPGKIRSGLNGCAISYGGSEHTLASYEVLTGASSSASQQNDYGGHDIAGLRMAEKSYATVGGWTVLRASVDGAIAYCVAQTSDAGAIWRIGFDRQQWQLAFPMAASKDWQGTLEVDGDQRPTGGSAGNGWTFVWLQKPERDRIGQGSSMTVRIGRSSVRHQLHAAAAVIAKIEECVNGR